MSSNKFAARGQKSSGQVRAIFGAAKSLDLNDDELRAVVEEVTGTRSISQLTRNDAARVIDRLSARLSSRPSGSRHCTPRRTVQYRRKRAGVVQLATPSHLELMRSLARHRNMSDEGLEQLSRRMVGHFPPRTTVDTSKVVEALKAMNRREALQ